MERKSAGLRARRMTEADLEPRHRLLSDRARRQGRGVVIECVPEQTVTRHIAEKSGFRFCGMAEGCCVYRRQPDEKEPL